MGKTYIYALTDPDTQEVRYIGKADNPQKRLNRHLGQFEPKPTHKSNWIKSLLEIGKQPGVKILEEVDESEWQSSERKWINEYKSSGANLTNTTDGGEGGKTLSAESLSPEERERRRKHGRDHWNRLWAEARAYRNKL